MGQCVSVRKTSAVHMKIIISTTDRLSSATNNYVDKAQLQLCYFGSLLELCHQKPVRVSQNQGTAKWWLFFFIRAEIVIIASCMEFVYNKEQINRQASANVTDVS